MPKHIEIMDTTLRDGEQTSGVSYSPKEKLTIAKLLLDDLKIDWIEVASARVSEGELNSVKEISSWAEKNNKINTKKLKKYFSFQEDFVRDQNIKLDTNSSINFSSFSFCSLGFKSVISRTSFKLSSTENLVKTEASWAK